MRWWLNPETIEAGWERLFLGFFAFTFVFPVSATTIFPHWSTGYWITQGSVCPIPNAVGAKNVQVFVSYQSNTLTITLSVYTCTILDMYIWGTGSDAPLAVLHQKWVFLTGEYFTPGRQIVLIPTIGYENQSNNIFLGCMVYKNRCGFFNNEEYRNFGQFSLNLYGKIKKKIDHQLWDYFTLSALLRKFQNLSLW